MQDIKKIDTWRDVLDYADHQSVLIIVLSSSVIDKIGSQ